MRRLEGLRPSVGDPAVMRDQSLVGEVERINAHVLGRQVEGEGGRPWRHTAKVGHEGLHEEHTTRLQMRGCVGEARHLLGLRQQIGDRVEHDVNETELALHPGGSHVAQRHSYAIAPGLGEQPLNHWRRDLDPLDLDAPGRKGQCDAAGADGELEDAATPGELDEQIHCWVQDLRLEHRAASVVIRGGDPRVEDRLRHGRSLAPVERRCPAISGGPVPPTTSTCSCVGDGDADDVNFGVECSRQRLLTPKFAGRGRAAGR